MKCVMVVFGDGGLTFSFFFSRSLRSAGAGGFLQGIGGQRITGLEYECGPVWADRSLLLRRWSCRDSVSSPFFSLVSLTCI